MPAKNNTTTTRQFSGVNPREIDFVTRFQSRFQALMELIGITRPIRKEPGTALRVLRASVDLQSGNVGEGEEVPYSQATVIQIPVGEATVEKYSKGVTIESIKTYGYDVAVARTDDAFLAKLQGNVNDKLYAFLGTGELTNIQKTFQAAVAMARGLVINQFKKSDLELTDVVGFVNVLDFYQYLGGAEITTQTVFGLTYIKDFMGYRVIFLGSDRDVPRGKVYATPAENLVAYYVDPSDSDFARAGLVFTSWGDTPFLGFHTEGNYKTMTSESYAIIGLSLLFEYINGVAVVSIQDSGTMGALTVTSAAGAESGTTKLTVTGAAGDGGNTLRYKVAAAAATPAYLADVSGWAIWDGISDITAASSQVITLAEANGSGQAIAAGNATVVAKA